MKTRPGTLFLMTVYACGLRLAEARHLKTTDIDRARMQLRVRKGKGGKERVLPLSNRLLQKSLNVVVVDAKQSAC